MTALEVWFLVGTPAGVVVGAVVGSWLAERHMRRPRKEAPTDGA